MIRTIEKNMQRKENSRNRAQLQHAACCNMLQLRDLNGGNRLRARASAASWACPHSLCSTLGGGCPSLAVCHLVMAAHLCQCYSQSKLPFQLAESALSVENAVLLTNTSNNLRKDTSPPSLNQARPCGHSAIDCTDCKCRDYLLAQSFHPHHGHQTIAQHAVAASVAALLSERARN